MKEILHGDCLDVMRKLKDNSIDTIITDPPYGLSFMGKKWDYDVPDIETWEECLRVLKPGGTALIFAGSRTQHRMAVNVEDAGFILKDCIMWLYGSGFPKATDISKQIDKNIGVKREVVCTQPAGSGPLKNGHTNVSGGGFIGDERSPELKITKPASLEARRWDGWKSHGLKPAYEPILVAAKPNDGTYANNALEWGVSGLNIDGGRIETDEKLNGGAYSGGQRCEGDWKDHSGFKNDQLKGEFEQPKGRFPANVILDEESAHLLDKQKPFTSQTGNRKKKIRVEGELINTPFTRSVAAPEYLDSGGPSRFFYCAKTSKKERGEGNNHPTVKPLKLIEYLCTLTKTPMGGIVLDPFAGSGTTGLAALNTGRPFILIEKEKDYYEIIKKRLGGGGIMTDSKNEKC